MKSLKLPTLALLALALLGPFQGCGTGSGGSGGSAPVGEEKGALGVMCTLVPGEFVNAGDGCDCPSDGDTSCDPDCAVANPGGGYCGCEFCYPEQPPPPGEQCGLVPAEYLNAGDGCDCPSNGNQTCDPDCASGNQGGAYCGCEFCYPETAPPPPVTAYVPPAEGAAFGIPGTPPSVPVNGTFQAQAVGRLPGGGEVSQDGAYTYSLPIQVPPGRGGMEPAISLNYNSRAGNGPLGMGWSLSAGQSVITRCGKHYASGFRLSSSMGRLARATDGVKFSVIDQLCLDGEKLEVVSGVNAAPGSEYRTEVDEFAKIVAGTGCSGCEPDTFKVYHKNGLIGTYTKHGGTNASGTALAGFYREGATSPVTLVWAQTQLEDRSGNAIKYTWTKENATTSGAEQSMPRLTDIDYTTCTTAGGGLCPYGTAGLRKVKFTYQTRADARYAYVNGVRIDDKYRLSAISVNGDVSQSETNWDYFLGYNQSAFTGRSLLSSVQQCKAPTCLPTTTFTWQDAGKNTWEVHGMQGPRFNIVWPGQAGFSGSEPNASEMTFVLFDADGDGHKDVILKEWPLSAIDANGALIRDVASLGVGPVDELLMSDRSGYFSTPQQIDLEGDGIPQASARCGGGGALQGEIADLSATLRIDLDQDGRDELFAPLNTGCPFQFAPGTSTNGMRMTPALVLTPRDPNTSYQRVYTVLNYDRATSRLKRRAQPLPSFNTGFWDTWKYAFADLTGDGLPEVLYGATGSGDAVNIAKALFTGSGETEGDNPEIQYAAMGPSNTNYDTGLRFSWQQQNSSARTPTAIRVLDENGDGREELLQPTYDGDQRGFGLNSSVTQAVRTYRSADGNTSWTQAQNLDGTGGAPANQWPAYPGPNALALNGAPMSWRYADINGDGLKDALYSLPQSGGAFPWYYRINTGNGYLPPQQLMVGGASGSSLLWSYGQASELTQVNGVLKVPQDVGLRIADMNGDGLDDLVLLDTPNGSILYGNGSGFDAPVDMAPRASSPLARLSLPNNVQKWPMSQLDDLDGDGLTDLIEFVIDPNNSRRRVLVTERRFLPDGFDVITSVSDGVASSVAENVSYDSLSDQLFHSSDARFSASSGVSKICRYPARCVSTGKAVLRYRNFRDSRNVDVGFHYAGARFDVTGRGFLGFREVKSLDNVTGMETTQTYDQGSLGNVVTDLFHLYPMLSTPATTVSFQNAGHDPSLADPDGRRTKTTTTWVPTFNGSLPLRTTRSVTTTTLTDINNFLQMSSFAEDRTRHVIDVQYSNDQFGNVTTSSETTQDLGQLDQNASLPNVTSTRTASYTYLGPDASTWVISLPTAVTVTSTTDDPGCSAVANCSSVTQNTWFEYESNARRLLHKITREPLLGTQQKRFTVLERDDAGLVRRTRVQDSAGKERVSEMDFDASGVLPVKTRNAMGHVGYLQYHKQLGLLDRATDPNGVSVNYTYDALGRLRRTARSDGTFESLSFSRTTEGSEVVNAVTVSTATGADSKIFFDPQGRVTETITPGYMNSAGAVPDNTISLATSYDALGNVTLTSFTRVAQAWSNAKTATLASLRTAHAAGAEIIGGGSYDVLGRPARVDTGDPNKSAPTEGAAERRAYQYPRLGEIDVLEPFSNGIQNEMRTIADARGNARRVYHENAGVTASRIPTDYTYTALGKVTVISPQNAPIEKLLYDTLGRQTAWYMGGSAETRLYTYTAFDEVATATEAREMTTSYEYDALGRLTAQTKDAGSAASERYTYEWDTSERYDANCQPTTGVTLGALARASSPGGAQQNYYDPQGRPCLVRELLNGTEATATLDFRFGYDGFGRRTSMQYPKVQWSSGALGSTTQAPLKVQYAYATNGALLKVVDATTTSPVDLWRVLDRHPLGMLAQATNSAGVVTTRMYQTNTLHPKEQDIARPSSPAVTAKEQYAYHETGQLKSRTYDTTAFKETYGYATVAQRLTDYTRGAGATNTTQVDADYSYNNAGDIQSLVTNTAVLPDLGPVGTQVFGYGFGDPNGGTAQSYTNLLTTIDPSTVGPSGTISYGYDTAGRQRSRMLGGVRTRTIVGYNAFNLPTQIDLQNGSTVQSSTSFKYDAFGNRIYKKRTTPGSADQVVVYANQLFEAQRFVDSSTSPATQVERVLGRVYAEGMPIAEISTTSGGTRKVQFVYTDDQGSVNYRTDGTASVEASGQTGAASGFRSFTPFGKRWSQTGATQPMFSSIGYTGHAHDDDLGLINMRGRIYDVEQHRFISRDPVVRPYALGGTNAYAYVLGNPTNFIDPSGFSECPNGDPNCGGGGGQGALGDGPGWVKAACTVIGWLGIAHCKKAKPKDPNHTDISAYDQKPPPAPKPAPKPAPPPEPPPLPDCGGIPCDPSGMRPPPFTEPASPPPGSQDPMGAPILTDQQGPIFGDDVATPPPAPPGASSGASSSIATKAVEAAAWLGGWRGAENYATPGAINYGPAGAFMTGLNAKLNGTMFSLAFGSGLMSLAQPAEPELAGAVMAGERVLVAPSLAQANRAAGNAARDVIAEALRNAGREVYTEVYKSTPLGRRFIDIEVWEGGRVLGGVEVKLGSSPYKPQQRAKDMWLWMFDKYPVNLVREPRP